ncbi:class I SAM-dependent rRNA methyltransferase [Neolewinella lacunae]|uniref:Class I SAM-dependent methyltransferase n=1 Tax=Neolewinella lacunae TaxID=1517758 RepID=A0A923T9P8_9BACT|nr:class I SAM-dependent rRNA methyltransferase [Neolewinella lacunae]MBC6995771.1 class I SAM-dependent methyltransferase [Neolewinella lacunae]MDN3636536.1 class I SAM-dependent rRNA methyltransferase [Neolewinella lacunae]
MNRIPVTLTAAGERALRAGHPWIFDQAIARVKGEGKAGDLAVVFSFTKNKCIGVGLFEPDSAIRIRMLHHGGSAQIDGAFFRARMLEARALRTELLATDTNGYRLLHGENDGFPGLVADVFAGVAVVKLYAPAWLPWLEELVPIIAEVAQAPVVVLRLARNTEVAAAALGFSDGQVLLGDLPDPEVVFTEHGCKFIANVVHGHKTGFFLDHRANRRRVGALAEGREVLDVFSYAGGFSVHALAGGAAKVTSLDVSRPALEQARANVRFNFGNDPRHQVLADDAFEALEGLRKAEKEFDLVIVDPPSFAKRDKEVSGALAAYRKIMGLAIPLVAPGGLLVAASCSARVSAEDFFRTIEGTLRATGRGYHVLEKTYHDADHPIGFPEGAYLKTGYYQFK